jgi:outer membrane lipoprotein-sorting protein
MSYVATMLQHPIIMRVLRVVLRQSAASACGAASPSTRVPPLPAGALAIAVVIAVGPGFLAAAKADTPAIRDFDIRYVVTGEGGPGEIRLQFAAPDRWRIESRDRKTDETVVAAGGSVFTYDRKRKGVLWQARDQAQRYCDLEIDLAARAPLSEAGARKRMEGTGVTRPAEQRVLGCECLVYECKPDIAVASPSLPTMSAKTWLDKQLLIPLRVETYIDSALDRRVEAVSVQVNQGVPRQAFRFQMPRGGRVFKGALTSVPEVPFASLRPPTDLVGDLPWGMHGVAAIYVPSYLPADLRSVGTQAGLEGEWFGFALATSHGATLVLEETRDPKSYPLAGLPGARAVKVGRWDGHIAERTAPFPRVVLVWDAKPWRLRIDAAGIPKSEVLKVAASTALRPFEPVEMFKHLDPVAAQAKVNFLVLAPQTMLEGMRLISSHVTPGARQGDSCIADQVSMSYIVPGRGTLTVSELAGGPGEMGGKERVEIGSYSGGFTRRNDELELTWVQDGTAVILSGDFTRAELLSLARSMALADPSARERVRQYQQQHPPAEFEPFAGDEVASPTNAQAQVNFLLLIPKTLPEGFALRSTIVTPYSKRGDTETPEQVSMMYANPRGDMLWLLEMRPQGIGEIEGAKPITISGHPGWQMYDAKWGYTFEWEQEGTEVSLSGKLPRAESLKIAASLVLAAPSARERVTKH